MTTFAALVEYVCRSRPAGAHSRSSGRLFEWSQMAGTPHDPEGRVFRRTCFDPLHGEALALVERTRALVGDEMFDIQPISVSGQLRGDDSTDFRRCSKPT
jgi:hypothetical protein